MLIPVPTRCRLTALAGVLLTVMLSWPAPADAQVRHGGRVGRPVVVTAGFYRPFYGPFFHHPYLWGFPGFWGFPGWQPFWGYPMMFPMGPQAGSARLQVTPKDTEVYLDGRLVGVADDFDGRFQRLRVPPGQYMLELYREGTRAWQRPVLLTAGSTLNIDHRMEPLATGETGPQRPAPRAEVQPEPTPATAPVAEASTGALSLRVEPGDAEVMIDGESWGTPAAGTRLLVRMSPGRHQLLVRRAGYQSHETEVDVAVGTTLTLNIDLRPQP